jgi:putative flippase GtrA
MTPVQTAKRIGRGTLKPGNWIQLLQFGLVGGSGYVVNLAVFAVVNGPLSIHYIPAAILAFCVAVTNNFWWNRHWTFRAGAGRAETQAPRFFAVSVGAFLFALAILELLVSTAGVPELPAQAIAIVAATPLNFVGNKMWSFAIEVSRD